MRIAFSRLAEGDLEGIADYIAIDNPRRAITFIGKLQAHCVRIADTPRAWPLRPELGSRIRSSTHGRYVVFFRCGIDQVLVARVLHGAHDLLALPK